MSYMFDVRRMQVLRAVVSTGSVTAAATRLGYTPSAVSQQVAALERQAGMALLERVGRGVRPTAAGRLLTEHAAVIDGQVAQAAAALADLRAGRTGQITIGYFATAGATLVAPAIARLRQQHPGVQIDLRMTDPGDPLPELTQGRMDLAIVIRAHGQVHKGVHLVHLLDEPYHAVLPKGHRLASKQVVSLTDLADEPWVGSERPGPCRDAMLGACTVAGFRPNVVLQSQDYPTAQAFVAAGLGVSLIPHMGLTNRHPDIVERRVRDPEPVRSIHAAVRGTSLDQPALSALLTALKGTAAR